MYTHTHIYTHIYIIHTQHIFFIYLSVNGHLGCFHVLAIINSVVVYIGVHVSFLIIVLLKCMSSWVLWQGFPGSSGGKESTCNAGDSDSIPGWGRSPGERKGYPLQYSWASLVAQVVKNLPAICETWVRSLDWEDPLEEGIATHSSILAWRIPMDRGAWWAIVHRVLPGGL